MAGAVFPWHGANKFKLLIDGPQFFPQMLAAIEQAQDHIDLEFLSGRGRAVR